MAAFGDLVAEGVDQAALQIANRTLARGGSVAASGVNRPIAGSGVVAETLQRARV
jgi:hypothetical protein